MSSSSSFFVLTALFYTALAQNHGYQGYEAPAPSLIPVTPGIYASNVASDMLSSSFPLPSGSTKVNIQPSGNTAPPSIATTSAPPFDYAGETIPSSFGVSPFVNITGSTQYPPAQPTASAFNVTAIFASASAYLNSTSFLAISTFSEPSYVNPSIATSSAPPLDYSGEPLTLTVDAYNSTSYSEPAYAVPTVVTSSAPPLDFAGEPIASSSTLTHGGMPYGNITNVNAQPTASQYNITAVIASATAYWNTTNLSTGVSTPISSLAAGNGSSTLRSGYSSIVAPLNSPATSYGLPNSSIAVPTAGHSSDSGVTLTASSSSATTTTNAPITLTVIPVAANTSLASSSDVPAAISSALSQITANASASLPANITARLSSAIAQITSLAGPETFNASNTMPPESIIAGISSAVAQITSLAGLTSAASESDDFESATPPSVQSTVSGVDNSATSVGREVSSTVAAVAAVSLTSTSASVLSSAPAYGHGDLPSTLITQTVTATTQVSAQASAGQTSSAQSSTYHGDGWLAEILSWTAGVIKDAFGNDKE